MKTVRFISLIAVIACTGWMVGVAHAYTYTVRQLLPLAEQGNSDAQNNLGNMYYEGRGVRKDEQEAVRWIKKAARQGNKAAIKSLKILGMTD